MFTKLKNIFGLTKPDYAKFLNEGALIVDVRSIGEYATGHIKESINIPLEKMDTGIEKIKNKNITIITCCASGMRSAAAKKILRSKGYTSVYNGGSWSHLQRRL